MIHDNFILAKSSVGTRNKTVHTTRIYKTHSAVDNIYVDKGGLQLKKVIAKGEGQWNMCSEESKVQGKENKIKREKGVMMTASACPTDEHDSGLHIFNIHFFFCTQ